MNLLIMDTPKVTKSILNSSVSTFVSWSNCYFEQMSSSILTFRDKKQQMLSQSYIPNHAWTSYQNIENIESTGVARGRGGHKGAMAWSESNKCKGLVNIKANTDNLPYPFPAITFNVQKMSFWYTNFQKSPYPASLRAPPPPPPPRWKKIMATPCSDWKLS